MPLETKTSSQSEVLVIGLGNPILGDDGVGWRVVQHLAARSSRDAAIEMDCLSVGGLGLMERMLGYKRVILVDAMVTGANPVGTVSVLGLTDLKDPEPGHTTSSHDASLGTALQAAAAAGATTPERVDIVAIEAETGSEFTEDLSPPVAAAIPVAAVTVLDLVQSARLIQRR